MFQLGSRVDDELPKFVAVVAERQYIAFLRLAHCGKRHSFVPTAVFDQARTVQARDDQRDRLRTSSRVNDGQRRLSEDVRMTSQLQ